MERKLTPLECFEEASGACISYFWLDSTNVSMAGRPLIPTWEVVHPILR